MSMIGRRTALKSLGLTLLAMGTRTVPIQALAVPALASLGLLTQLEGRWEGTGMILGQASRVQMEWARVLDGRFMRLTAPDRMEVVDRVRGKNGAWREFGRSTLSRTLRDA